MNLYEKLNRLDDSKSLRESAECEYCIVAKTFDGKTKFYKDGAFIDDYKSCTTFNDLDDARSEWFDVDKTKYKRVFVPVYDPEAFAKVITECNESIDDMDRRCEKCNTLLNDGGTCPKCDDGEEDYGDMYEALDPEDVERNHGYRQDDLKDTFDIGDRVAHRWADEYNVGTIKDKRENEGIQYKVEWDYSEGDKVEWLYGDEITHWVDVAPVKEELSNREKLKRAYPELNFNEKLMESNNRVKIEVKYETYGRYGDGGDIKTGRVSGSTEVEALMKMLDHVHMYTDSDYAEEFKEESGRYPTTEEVTDKLYEQNGDGCDLIYWIRNLTTGKMIFDGAVEESEPEEWDDDIDDINW